jgi:hypothetical protein
MFKSNFAGAILMIGIAVCLTSLSACGGGGGGTLSSASTSPPPPPPVVTGPASTEREIAPNLTNPALTTFLLPHITMTEPHLSVRLHD